MRAALEGLDAATVADLARRATGRAGLRTRRWTVTPVAGGASGAPIYRVGGVGRAGRGRVPWSVVVKRRRPGPDADPADLGWKRAALAYGAGLLPRAADGGGLVAAELYAAADRPDGSVWLWMEDLAPCVAWDAWPPERYGLAARHLAAFSARSLSGGPLSGHAWLSRAGFLPFWLEQVLGRWTLATIPEAGWDHPLGWFTLTADLVTGLLQTAAVWDQPLVRAVYPAPVAARLLRLWTDRARLLEGLARVPRALAHGDAHPWNLFGRVAADGREQTVAIDWDAVGLSALGEDAGHLFAAALLLSSGAPEVVARLHDAIWGGYLAGLRAAGWRGPERAVRYAFAAHAALFTCLPTAGMVPAALSPELRGTRYRQGAESFFRAPLEALAAPCAAAGYRLLELADEAGELLGAL
jgi:hypothetical protein